MLRAISIASSLHKSQMQQVAVVVYKHYMRSMLPECHKDLQVFGDNVSSKAIYTSHGAVVEFIGALGIWVEEHVLKQLHKASVSCVVADEWTDIKTLVELSQDGIPIECFLDKFPLKKADAKKVFKCLKDDNQLL